eukprot:173894_1
MDFSVLCENGSLTERITKQQSKTGKVLHSSKHQLVVHGYIHLIIQPLLSKNNTNSIVPIELFRIIHTFYKSNYVNAILMTNISKQKYIYKQEEDGSHSWKLVGENKTGIYAFGSVGSNGVSNKCIELGSFRQDPDSESQRDCAYVVGKNIHLKYPLHILEPITRTVHKSAPDVHTAPMAGTRLRRRRMTPEEDLRYQKSVIRAQKFRQARELYREQLLTLNKGFHGIFKTEGNTNGVLLIAFKENVFDYDYFDNKSLDSLEISLPLLPTIEKCQMVYNNFIGLFVASENDAEFSNRFVACYYHLVNNDNKLKWKEIENIHKIASWCSLVMINNNQVFICGLTMNYIYDFECGTWIKCAPVGNYDKYPYYLNYRPPLCFDKTRNQIYVLIQFTSKWKLKAYAIDTDIWIDLPNFEASTGSNKSVPFMWMMDLSGPDILHYVDNHTQMKTNKIQSYDLQSKHKLIQNIDIDAELKSYGIENNECHFVSPPMYN